MAGLKLNTQTAPQIPVATKTAPGAPRPGATSQGGSNAPGTTNPPLSSSSSTTHPQLQARPPRPPQAPSAPTAGNAAKGNVATPTAAHSSPTQPKHHVSTHQSPPRHQQAHPPVTAPAPASSTAASKPADDPGPPPVSPITPPLQPLKSTTPIPPPTIPPNFASLGGRGPPLTHVSHPSVVPSAPPPLIATTAASTAATTATAAPGQAAAIPEPVDFEDNADVIALRATIGILLQQRRRAEEDLRKLRDAKSAAIERPLEFVRDLTEGRVGQDGAGSATAKTASDGEESSSDDEEEQKTEGEKATTDDVEMKDEGDDQDSKPANRLKPSAMKAKTSRKGKGKESGSSSAAPAAPPWANLPKPQDIARCPPINWAQYAVQGEALDRLHSEQLSRPTLGTPAVLNTNGTYEFTGAPNPNDGKRVDGIAVPFNPLRDKIVDKKTARPGASSRRGA